jgi:hypothetical protein
MMLWAVLTWRGPLLSLKLNLKLKLVMVWQCRSARLMFALSHRQQLQLQNLLSLLHCLVSMFSMLPLCLTVTGA